jgi:hypothetical protein
MDKNNLYTGSLIANEPLCDIRFDPYNKNSLFGISNDSLYEWDFRKMEVCKLKKKYLGFCSLAVLSDCVGVGCKLGSV